MRILAISDEELGNIYNPQIRERFKHIDIAISCGISGPQVLLALHSFERNVEVTLRRHEAEELLA